jgi:25S rRNA (adenine2142-N1)-methyltransferase
MGHGHKKKKVVPIVPIGKRPSVSAQPVTSLKLARKLTSKFHALLNEETALKTGIGAGRALDPAEKTARLKEIAVEIAAAGGRERYQEASALATKHFRSSRFVFKHLVKYGLQPKKGEAPLNVLEIGAVNAQLVVCPWLRVRAIDITSRDSKHIEQKDFFEIPVKDAVHGEYDVIVNAMVINCVPDIIRRGEMILRCHDHLKPGGLMFFALPARCIDMSEYFTRSRFEALVAAAGFTIRDDHRTPKISFYILQRTDGVDLRSSDASTSVPAWHTQVGGKRRPASEPVDRIFSVTSVFLSGTARSLSALEPAADVAADSGSEEEEDGSYAHAGVGEKRKREVVSKAVEKGHKAASEPALSSLRKTMMAAAAQYAICHTSVPAGKSNKAAAPDNKWVPVVFARTVASKALLSKLSPPPTTLPRAELPVTGFTLTDFCACIVPDWVHSDITVSETPVADVKAAPKPPKPAVKRK